MMTLNTLAVGVTLFAVIYGLTRVILLKQQPQRIRRD
jgi:hypothetical protein